MSALAAKQPLAGGFTRRGACPALSAPMQTGDGLLVRLNPVAGGLSPAQLAGLCDAAGMFGNGVIEVTARGSMQVRGLTSASAAPFAEAIDRLGIAALFDYAVDAGRIARSKPDPEIFLAAASGLGVAPEECLGVEDAAAGIAALHAAGMAAVGIGRAQELDKADVLLPDIAAFDISRFIA